MLAPPRGRGKKMDDVTAAADAPGGDQTVGDQVLYCVFLGCPQRGVPTVHAKCPECERHTSAVRPARPIPEAAAPAFAPTSTGPAESDELPWMRSRPARATPLVADALRVAGVFNLLSWVVVILGVLSGLLVVLGSLSADNFLGALVGLLAAIGYTAGAWALMMLGSIVARHVANQN